MVTVGPWTGQGGDDPDAPATFRPTHLMRRVSETLERQPRELTKSKVATVVGGKKKATPEAVDSSRTRNTWQSRRGETDTPCTSR